MSYYVIGFLVLVAILIISKPRKKNKRRKNNHQNTEEKYTRRKSSDELFNNFFGNLENVQGVPKREHKEPSFNKAEGNSSSKTASNQTNGLKNNHKAEEKKELTFAEKKQNDYYTTNLGGIRIRGGLLPKHLTSGRLDIYYDGKKTPSVVGSRGKVKIWKTDGNIQVLYKDLNDIKDMEFQGLIVDMYKI